MDTISSFYNYKVHVHVHVHVHVALNYSIYIKTPSKDMFFLIP